MSQPPALSRATLAVNHPLIGRRVTRKDKPAGSLTCLVVNAHRNPNLPNSTIWLTVATATDAGTVQDAVASSKVEEVIN